MYIYFPLMLQQRLIRLAAARSNQLLVQCRYMGRAALVRAATKARTDSAKQKNNNRFAKKIIMAVKQKGPDPLQNSLLASIIEDAREAAVPKDVITRNIEKGSSTTTANFKEALFEFYGHGGVGLLVNVLTDNDNRAAKDIFAVAGRNNLKQAASGSVAFNFAKKARFDVMGHVLDDEKVTELCIEAGVDDFILRTDADGSPHSPQNSGDSVIYVDVPEMAIMRDYMISKGYKLSTSLRALPLGEEVALGEEDFEANMKAISLFENLDDVDSVEHNIKMTD